MTEAVVIRPARPSDSEALIDVHIASWKVAYRGQLPDEFLDRLDESRARRLATWPRIFASDRERVFVAERGGTILRFAHVGPARAPAAPGLGELYAIYLHPSAWGEGVGRALLLKGEETLRALGYRTVVLWVLDTNRRARRFYEAGGWSADGETKVEHRGAVTLNEVRYAKELGSKAGG